MLGLNFSKKGNVAAVVLIIMVLLLALGVFMYQPFVDQEESVNYGEVFSEVRSDVERGVFENVQTSLRSGFEAIGGTGTFYWNGAYNISDEEIEQELADNVGDHEVQIEYEGGSATVPIENESVSVSLEEDGLRIQIANETIEAEIDGENRTVQLEDEYVVDTDLNYKVERINDWLACDMGNVTGKFLALHESMDCQFRNCCCTVHNLTVQDVRNAVQEEGIQSENVSKIFRESISVLNDMLANEDLTCEGAIDNVENNDSETMEGFECRYNEETSTIRTRNDYVDLDYIDYSGKQEICDNPTDDCMLEPEPSENVGTLKDWGEPTLAWNESATEGREKLNGTGTLSPYMQNSTVEIADEANEDLRDYIQDNNGKLPQGEDNQSSMWFSSGSEKMAEGDVGVTCRNPDMNIEDPEEVSFSLKFKNRYECPNDVEDPQELEEGDDKYDQQTDEEGNPLACKGSPGGAAGTIQCETMLEGSSCPNLDPNDYGDLADHPDVADNIVELIEDGMKEEWSNSCIPWELTCAEQPDDAVCTLPFLVEEDGTIDESLNDPSKSGQWEFPDHREGSDCDICGTCNAEGQCAGAANEGIVCPDNELGQLRGENINSGEAGQWVCNGEGTGEASCEFEVTNCDSVWCEGEPTQVSEHRYECDYSVSDGNYCDDATFEGCDVDGVCQEGVCEVDEESLGEDDACCGGQTYNSDTHFCCDGNVWEDNQANRDACDEDVT